MGVPSLFSYFFKRYHKCVTYTKKTNRKFDWFFFFLFCFCFLFIISLYLDFNSILHECSHPGEKLFPLKTEEMIFQEIFIYIDFLIKLIQPRKLLYIAIG
jgi:5'-3' exoribonuclease 2